MSSHRRATAADPSDSQLTEEEIAELKKQRNRLAARKCRTNKKTVHQNLESEVKALRKEKVELQEQVRQLEIENIEARTLLCGRVLPDDQEAMNFLRRSRQSQKSSFGGSGTSVPAAGAAPAAPTPFSNSGVGLGRSSAPSTFTTPAAGEGFASTSVAAASPTGVFASPTTHGGLLFSVSGSSLENSSSGGTQLVSQAMAEFLGGQDENNIADFDFDQIDPKQVSNIMFSSYEGFDS